MGTGEADTLRQDESKGIWLSVTLHALVATLILVKGVFFPGTPLPYTPSLRVDLVGLPDQLKNEIVHPSQSTQDQLAKLLRAEEEAKAVKPLPPMGATSEPDTDTAEKDEMVLKPHPAADSKARRKKLMSALDRIKALEKIQSSLNQEQKKDLASNAVLIKGNKLSKGGSLSAEARESEEAGYLDRVREKLQENWALPVWLQRQGYSAKVVIGIDSRGMVRSLRFDQNSGSTQFDEAVRKTIQDSQPFDPPPAEIAAQTLNNGIPFAFPL